MVPPYVDLPFTLPGFARIQRVAPDGGGVPSGIENSIAFPFDLLLVTYSVVPTV